MSCAHRGVKYEMNYAIKMANESKNISGKEHLVFLNAPGDYRVCLISEYNSVNEIVFRTDE